MVIIAEDEYVRKVVPLIQMSCRDDVLIILQKEVIRDLVEILLFYRARNRPG